MTTPDPYHVMRVALLGEASVTGLLLPQASLPTLAVAPIFAYRYPRKVAGAPLTGSTGHDFADLLHRREVALVVIRPSGRVPSGGDTSRAQWSRPRMDIEVMARTDSQAMAIHLAIEAFLKALLSQRVTLAAGVALLYDVTVEGGPIDFDDPETEAPEVVGIYAASVAEVFVA
jgi:hypothetical protein